MKPGPAWACACAQVYAYRMGLWAEHLGGQLQGLWNQPHSLACVRRVNELADRNWHDFAGDQDVDMRGHLVKCAKALPRGSCCSPWARPRPGSAGCMRAALQPWQPTAGHASWSFVSAALAQPEPAAACRFPVSVDRAGAMTPLDGTDGETTAAQPPCLSACHTHAQKRHAAECCRPDAGLALQASFGTSTPRWRARSTLPSHPCSPTDEVPALPLWKRVQAPAGPRSWGVQVLCTTAVRSCCALLGGLLLEGHGGQPRVPLGSSSQSWAWKRVQAAAGPTL